MHYAEETRDPLLIGAVTWYIGQAALSNDMPHIAVSTLVKRAKPSYASEVREFAGRIGLLN